MPEHTELALQFLAPQELLVGPVHADELVVLGSPIVRSVAVFQYLRGVLDAIIEQTDIDAVALRVGELLDESLVVDAGGEFEEWAA